MERLSGLDASFLYMETPSMQMHVCFTVICDPKGMPGGFSFQKVVDLLENRALLNKEFRRRLIEVPLDLDHPVWVDDPSFDIVHHVRHVALPEPGGMQELGAMIGRIGSSLLDRRHPLWEAWVIEGLADGRFALFVKFHHAAVDGVSGASLVQHLFDSEPVEPATVSLTRPTGEKIPSEGVLLTAALQRRATSPARFLRLIAKSVDSVGSILFDQEPSEPRSHGRATPYNAPRTHFNHTLGPRRNFAFAKVSLSDVRRIKDAAGVTVNDVVLGICGGALREFLKRKNDLAEKSLIAMVPASVRADTERDKINNRVSGMWATLATDVDDPRERLRLINDDTKDAKEDMNAIGADMLQDWAEFSAPRAFNLAVRLYSRIGLTESAPPVHNLIISNIPGPKQPLYCAGAKIDAIYPMGPVMEGVGLNITLLSYGDVIDFGLLVDRDLVPGVWELAGLIEKEFAKLKRIYGIAERKLKRRVPTKKKTKVSPKVKAKVKAKGNSKIKTKSKAKKVAPARLGRDPFAR